MACKSVAEIAGGMGLRSPRQLGLGLRPCSGASAWPTDAHTYPQVARGKGESFRVPLLRRGATHPWSFERATVGL